MVGPMTIDMSMETEEFITAEEYIRRHDAGELNPQDVRYATDNPKSGYIGGFYVKLKQPRYRIAVPSVGQQGNIYAR